MVQDRDAVRVRLTHKLAQSINGIDLSAARQGEEMVLSRRDASVLLAEGWVELLEPAKSASKDNGNGNALAEATGKTSPRRRSQRSLRSKPR